MKPHRCLTCVNIVTVDEEAARIGEVICGRYLQNRAGDPLCCGRLVPHKDQEEPKHKIFPSTAWVAAKHKCVWCGAQMLVRLSDRKQKCPNDCASGLGECPEHLLPEVSETTASKTVEPKPLEEVMKQHIQDTLVFTKGNKTKAAKLLGIDRRSLYRKMERYAPKSVWQCPRGHGCSDPACIPKCKQEPL